MDQISSMLITSLDYRNLKTDMPMGKGVYILEVGDCCQ